jgi:hypothetical protein
MEKHLASMKKWGSAFNLSILIWVFGYYNIHLLFIHIVN